MLPKRREPTRPGVILNEEFLRPLMISPKQLATKLGSHWNEQRVNAVIEGHEKIDQKIAQEFAGVLGNTPEFWMRLEQRHSEWKKMHPSGHEKQWKKAQ